MSATAALLATVAIRLAGGPEYRELTFKSPESAPIAVRAEYPADWAPALQPGDPATGVPAGRLTRVSLDLVPAPASPFQRWLNDHLFGLRQFDAFHVGISGFLQKRGPGETTESEIRLLKTALQQTMHPSDPLTFRQGFTAAGPMLQIDGAYGPPGNRDAFSIVSIFPHGEPGADAWTIVFRAHAPERMSGRVRRTLADVVSRVRLVRE